MPTSFPSALLQSDCPNLTLLARGKVRDVYEVDNEHLLFVATDRISAFDVVMKNGIPGKGILLTQISAFWFSWLGDRIPHHLVSAEWADMPASVQGYEDQLRGRAMLVKRLKILPVESIIRGYITGSGWSSYVNDGTVCGIALPEGLQQCDQLETPLYTPSTKAEFGTHDENIPPAKAREILGEGNADSVEALSLQLYTEARDFAATRGIIIADTKFEFGVDEQGAVVLADEILTPDSSRFWPAAEYEPGREQASFDKQFVRNYLESISFNKQDPVALPEDVIEGTLNKYIESYRILTGTEPGRW